MNLSMCNEHSYICLACDVIFQTLACELSAVLIWVATRLHLIYGQQIPRCVLRSLCLILNYNGFVDAVVLSQVLLEALFTRVCV